MRFCVSLPQKNVMIPSDLFMELLDYLWNEGYDYDSDSPTAEHLRNAMMDKFCKLCMHEDYAIYKTVENQHDKTQALQEYLDLKKHQGD